MEACTADDIKDGQLLGVKVGGRRILLANSRGRLYATDLVCTHADADLSNGFLGDGGVRCPLHLSVFCLDDGAPQNPPAEAPLQTYNVKTDGGKIYVGI